MIGIGTYRPRMIGIGTYRVSVVPPTGVLPVLDVTDEVQSVSWRWALSSTVPSQVQLAPTAKIIEQLAPYRARMCDLQIERSDEIVVRGPLIRRQFSDGVSLIASDPSWWGQRRLVTDELVQAGAVDASDHLAALMSGISQLDVQAEPSGELQEADVRRSSYRLVGETVRSFTATDMDFTVIGSTIRIGNPPSPFSFGTVDGDHLDDLTVIERGDLVATDVVVLGRNVIARVRVEEIWPDIEISPDRRTTIRMRARDVLAADELRGVGLAELRRRWPTPLRVTASLLPSTPVELVELIPSSGGSIDADAVYPFLSERALEVSAVEGRLSRKGIETISVTWVTTG